jgi:hypothetical protein
MRKISLALILAAAPMAVITAPPAAATGKIKCQAGPQAGWKTMDTLKAQLVKEGWTVKKVKIDGGCYEAYGRLPTGENVEAYFHPVSLEKLYVAQRGKVLFRKSGY